MRKTFLPLLLLVVCAACGHKRDRNVTDSSSPAPVHAEANGVYFWKTVLAPDAKEVKFLKDNNIGRAYVRFFDVVPDDSPIATEAVIPDATLKIEGALPVKQIIPTIFITQDAIKRMDGQQTAWAKKIVERVEAMCSYNNLPVPGEIQLDCDWTDSTREAFFKLCRAVRKEMGRGHVSSTIRLHQLSQPAPPVDYGVLMVYNTGSFKSASEANSILSEENVAPYLKNLSSYPLHLDVAYPAYGWQLLYRGNQFAGILRQTIPDDAAVFRRIDPTHIRVLKDYGLADMTLKAGDVIRIETSDFSTVCTVKQLVDKALGDKPHSNIIYHLDSENLSNYTPDEIKAFYN